LDRGGFLIFVGFTILYLLLLTRLLCFSHFGGGVATFSFGLKCDGDECDENEAFSFSFNTFGHLIQGCLSFFLFSDILIGGIKDRWGKGQDWEWRQTLLLNIKEFLGLCSCLYPIYNITKRAIKHGHSFSTSSFWNNASEWACGFAIGTCLIYCYYAYIYNTSPTGRSQSWLKERFYKLENLRDEKQYLPRLRIAAGIALILVGLLSIILLGTTWNNFDTSDTEDSEDVLTILLLIILPLVILAGVVLFFISSKSRDKEKTVTMVMERQLSAQSLNFDL